MNDPNSQNRTVVVWCPDWPLVAAGRSAVPAAILKANKVVACSRPARQHGVRLGQRRREAEGASPGLEMVEERPARDLRAFEAVVSAVGAFTPLVEMTRPGLCSLLARGPARYFGGEEALCEQLTVAATQAARAIGGPDAPSAQVGIADSVFAARLAARAKTIVRHGQSREWLAPLPLSVLGLPRLSELLKRLGISCLGQLAAMDEGVVSGRFGREGARAHRLASGLDDHQIVLGAPPLDMSVEREFEGGVESVETVTFLVAGLAEELVERLASRGLACTKLLVEASTEHGEQLGRLWRVDRPFTARTMLDRVRWQLEGWIGQDSGGAPSAGITLVRLSAGEVTVHSGRQLALSGELADRPEGVEHAIARVQGLLGHESIGTAVITGGRSPLEQVQFVPWGEPVSADPVVQPWPGQLPRPSPSVVYESPIKVTLRDGDGRIVEVNGRCALSGTPAQVFVAPGRSFQVHGWAGPWPYDERWWDEAAHRRRARMQVLVDDGSAHLLVLEHGSWAIEATYD